MHRACRYVVSKVFGYTHTYIHQISVFQQSFHQFHRKEAISLYRIQESQTVVHAYRTDIHLAMSEWFYLCFWHACTWIFINGSWTLPRAIVRKTYMYTLHVSIAVSSIRCSPRLAEMSTRELEQNFWLSFTIEANIFPVHMYTLSVIVHICFLLYSLHTLQQDLVAGEATILSKDPVSIMPQATEKITSDI